MSRRKAAGAGPNMEMEEETELRRGPWTLEEDNLLMNYIACHGEGRWNLLARCSGLKRTGKSCRLRWLNYLKPDIKRGNLTPEEQLLILELHSKWGNRWSRIAQQLPGRTDNEIKNYWRTRVQKQARQLKVDANSAVFRDAVRCYWMPRLLEKMASSSSASAAAAAACHHHQAAPPPPMQVPQPAMSSPMISSLLQQETTTTTNTVVPAGRGSYQQCCYPVDPSPSTSTSGSGSTKTAALLPPVPCFSELNWDQYYSADLDGVAAGPFDSALLGSLGLDGLDLGPADLCSDSTLLDYLNSSCTASAMTTMMMSAGNYYNHSYCGGSGAIDGRGDHGSTTTTCQPVRKLGEWGG